MTTLELRTELHRLIDGVSDSALLQTIKAILQKRADTNEWREVLTARSRQADEEYAAGLGKDLNDLERDLDQEFPV